MLDDLLSGRISLPELVAWLVAVVIAITVHEYAHAKRADMAGDPTPRQHGRVTLNPLAHLDPVGTLTLLLFGLGWGRPVPVNPAYFRRYRWDSLMVSLWGPLSNFVVAFVFAMLVRLNVSPPHAPIFLIIALVNLLLGFFNLLPVYPLDGSHVVESLLPPPKAIRYAEFMHRWGLLILLAIILTRAGHILFVVPAYKLLTLLVG